MASEPILQVCDVHKSYGGLPVLQALSLDVFPSERVAIIGASGSGKSTLLRLIMTLEKPDSGDIIVEGDSLWTQVRDGKRVPADSEHLRRVRSKIGMVFQQFNLFPHMSVLRNVTLAPQLAGKAKPSELERRGNELLDMVGLSDKADEHPAQLSGGQKQRVAIARALAMEPKIMLYDEITSALDPELVDEVLNVLRRLADEAQMTNVLVTHEIPFAREFADRIVFLDQGRVLEEGPPEEMFTRPRQARTREFLQSVLGDSG